MIFIDTNIVIEYLKDKHFLDKYNFDELFINDIVLMELYQGARNKSDLAFIKKETSVFPILKMNQDIIVLARSILEKYNLSHNMKIMDALIAATVMIYELKLLTLNTKDFDYLAQINLLDIET